MADRCQVCDRETCDREASLERARVFHEAHPDLLAPGRTEEEEADNRQWRANALAADAAAADCKAHAVNWRERALTAQARADAAERRALEAVMGAALLRGALEPLWAYLQAHHGDWYLKAEKREHAARIEAALASNAGRKVLAVVDAARGVAARSMLAATRAVFRDEQVLVALADALIALDAEVPRG